jgi:hypothetical protein
MAALCFDRFKINPTFEGLLDPLSEDEFKGLDSSIAREGVLNPIIVWKEKRVIIEGHHRYKIAKKRRLGFPVKYLSFATEEEVVEWIIKHQLGKRNLSETKKRYHIGKLYELSKQTVGGQQEGVYHDDRPGTTASKVAEQVGASEATVNRAAEFARNVDALPEEQKAEVLSGKKKLPKQHKKPKSGTRKFDKYVFDNECGAMLRWIDKVARNYGLLTRTNTIKETPEILGLQRKFKEWWKEFTAWQKELEKNQSNQVEEK